MRNIAAVILQLAGIVGLAVAGFMQSLIVGVVVVSLCAVAVGVALERGN